jgi:hypothetical protein
VPKISIRHEISNVSTFYLISLLCQIAAPILLLKLIEVDEKVDARRSFKTREDNPKCRENAKAQYLSATVRFIARVQFVDENDKNATCDDAQKIAPEHERKSENLSTTPQLAASSSKH